MTGLPDLTADPRALHVCKRPVPVPVAFALADGVCETLEGPVHYQKGDALLTGVQGERYPVRRDLFMAAYVPVPPAAMGQDGLYLKAPQSRSPSVWTRRLRCRWAGRTIRCRDAQATGCCGTQTEAIA